jgi:hypothetical protein
LCRRAYLGENTEPTKKMAVKARSPSSESASKYHQR